MQDINFRKALSYAFDYDSFINEKEEKKQYAERFKKLSDYKAPFEFQWLPEAGRKEFLNTDRIEKRERAIEVLRSDIYISEAVNILIDLSSSIKKDGLVAQNKKR